MKLGGAIGLVLLAAIGVFAQPRPLPPGRGGPSDFPLIQGEFGVANQVVQGAPYSAVAVTQFTRTLPDGNHIQRTTTASIARDSQGRTRTDLTTDGTGNLNGSFLVPLHFKGVFINDAVAGVSYMLDPSSRTAHQMPLRVRRERARGSFSPRTMNFRNSASVKTEDLGTQTIQGVPAQGKRVTRTIPAGDVGNQQPIDIVTETWYSPDLQVTVMSKTTDPRFGETVYQLTNINRAEPDHSLFTVPPDYTLRASRPGPRNR